MIPLLCDVCGGPLPPQSEPHPVCRFCGTAYASENSHPVAPQAQASAVAIAERFSSEFAAFEASYARSQTMGNTPELALGEAAVSLAELCNTTTLCQVVLGMAREFQGRTGVDLCADGRALPRLAVSYLGALPDVAAQGHADLRIPFIAASAQGPLDYELRVTVSSLRGLARAGAAPVEKKGFFRRLFS